MRLIRGLAKKKFRISTGWEGEFRSIKFFRRVGEEIRFGKKKFIIKYMYVFSGVATAGRIRRMHDLKIIHIQIINT
jgi:hypothetical protein